MGGIGSHTSPIKGATDEWLTPMGVIDALGVFDLDPCAPIKRPWSTAISHMTIEDDGLARPWHGRVWLNPPYGPQTGRWLEKLANHGDGIALIFARTETEMFHTWGWDRADAMLFFKGRLTFHRVDGTLGKANAGGPSVLIAYGRENVDALRNLGAEIGKFILLRE